MHPRRMLLNVVNTLIYPQRLNLLARNVSNEIPALATIAQKQLFLHYQERWAAGAPGLDLRGAGFRVYSEADEDGILLYLFSRIGFRSRRCVDIGASPGSRSNTANLVLHHGFQALLIEAEPKSVAFGRRYYTDYPDTSILQPTIVQAFVSPANIDLILRDNGFEGEIDLLAIDIDGVDYWVWQAIAAVRPRVVLLEINRWWPADRSVSVPDRADFVMPATDPPYLYHGASLAAFAKLASDKGYRLIGHNNAAFNVFFMRCGEGDVEFPALTVEECLASDPMPAELKSRGRQLLTNYEWVEV